MVEPAPLTCPRCGSSDVRPVGRSASVRDPRYQHCEHCGLEFVVAAEVERRKVARAGFEADLQSIETEAARLSDELGKLRRRRSP